MRLGSFAMLSAAGLFVLQLGIVEVQSYWWVTRSRTGGAANAQRSCFDPETGDEESGEWVPAGGTGPTYDSVHKTLEDCLDDLEIFGSWGPSELNAPWYSQIPENSCVDFDGFDCSRYTQEDILLFGTTTSQCYSYGYRRSDNYDDDVVAIEACCVCGGGIDISIEPTCSDVDGWYDSDGPAFDCEWYSQPQLDYCNKYGGDQTYADDVYGLTANEACCACGGGGDPKPRSDPPLASCTGSYPDWKLEDVRSSERTEYRQTCEGFQLDSSGYDWCADSRTGTDGLTIYEACCHCWGAPSVSPSVPPSASPSAASPKVTGFILINADTDEPIDEFNPIPQGAVINLANLHSANLNIQAVTQGNVSPVRFGFDNNNDFHTESAAPYALCGDRGGDYFRCAPWGLGPHTVSATPNSGITVSVAFTLVYVPHEFCPIVCPIV